MSARVPVVVLGGSGYVAGELVRLLARHPGFALAAVISGSQAGAAVEQVFPHLRGSLGEASGLAFRPPEELGAAIAEAGAAVAVVSAAPHGKSAPLLDEALAAAAKAGVRARAVDISADFRFPTADAWEAIYRQPHPRPERIEEFFCGVPELVPGSNGHHAAHPGCFTTAVVLAAAPLVALGLVEPRIQVSAVTGSTGSGRTPAQTTHHPERHGNLVAYQPLVHRHEAEMRMLLARSSGAGVEVAFVPHSGPFARGIHATLHARLVEPLPGEEIRRRVAELYAGSPFVEVVARTPHLREVVGGNRCLLSYATRGDSLVAFAVLDNLVKGAAGGAVQWMNRQWGCAETAGLEQAGLGWI